MAGDKVGKSMNRPLNIAHRGFHKDFPDNTLEAFQAAIDLGVDGIEFDVRETADRNFAIFHDPKIDGAELEKLPLAEIQKVKLRDKYRIPTLEETLDLCRNRVKMIVELKQVKSEELLVEILKARADLEDITIASFSRSLILKFARLAPDIRRAIITALPVLNPVALAHNAKSDTIAIRLPLATARLVEAIHRIT